MKKIWLILLIMCSKICADDRWVTVFLHGGGAHPLYLNISDTFKILHDDILKSVYAKTTDSLREDPYFMKLQPQDREGMVRVWPLTEEKPIEE